MYKKLTAPEYHLILQTVELNDGIYIKYKSSKAAHCDTCKVFFTEDALEAVSTADVSDCRVDMGSEEDFELRGLPSAGSDTLHPYSLRCYGLYPKRRFI